MNDRAGVVMIARIVRFVDMDMKRCACLRCLGRSDIWPEKNIVVHDRSSECKRSLIRTLLIPFEVHRNRPFDLTSGFAEIGECLER